MNILNAIKELQKFSTDILSLDKPVHEDAIYAFEEKYNLKLPSDYKMLVRVHNGISLMGTDIYGIAKSDNSYSLEDCYVFEHYKVENKMPLHLIPFSPDGGGNHYCFDTRFCNNPLSCIVFWQHDYSYSNDDQPEIVNEGLGNWIKEVMIDWTLEDYNYDGIEKNNPRYFT
jgi:hypothetical protein